MDTYTRRSIKHCLNMIAPFEAVEYSEGRFSKEKSEGKNTFTPALVISPLQASETAALNYELGEKQFYEFITSIYKRMYDSPEEYFVFEMPYEEYRKKTVLKEGTEKAHFSDSKESMLRNTFQQAIQFYAVYFYEIGTRGEGISEKDCSFIISKEEYKKVLERMNKFHDAKNNKNRYALLKKMGISAEETGDKIYIHHKEYDKAMLGLKILCDAPDSKYKFMNYLRLDYKGFYRPVPEISDIVKTLPEESKEIIEQLQDVLSGLNTKIKVKPLRGIVSDFRWKVEYSYKSKNILGFYADYDYLRICIYFNDSKNITAFAEQLAEEDEILYEWYKIQFPELSCKCPNSRWVYFKEEKRRICGMSNKSETVNPTEEDFVNCVKILRKYRKI